MVNTHKKFPAELKNNTYYAADGSDIRDATEEEIVKYRLAASHKRRKPEIRVSSEKSVSSTAVAKEVKSRVDITPKRDTTRRREESPRNRDGQYTSKFKEDGKGIRTASRDSRRDREEMRENLARSGGEKRRGENTGENLPTERSEKAGGDNEVIDEDKRDRREMSEIRRRIEERKAAKTSVISHPDVGRVEKVAVTTTKSLDKEPRELTVGPKKVDEKPARPARVPRKTSTHHKESSRADAAQRESAMQWASTTASETEIVSTNAAKQGPSRSKSMITENYQPTEGDVAESIAIQDFIASQYPPVEGVVSSTVRLGRALVSGALRRKVDDPKMFETVVNIKECKVILQSTRKKSKVPVSAAPPNSTESERDMDESGSVQLSQFPTDVGVHIGLPEGEIELELRDATREPYARTSMEAEGTDAPRCPGIVSTPVLTLSEGVQQTRLTGPPDEGAQETPVETTESPTVQPALGVNPA